MTIERYYQRLYNRTLPVLNSRYIGSSGMIAPLRDNVCAVMWNTYDDDDDDDNDDEEEDDDDDRRRMMMMRRRMI